MNVVLYSTGCPKCNILKKKLLESNVDYTVVDDVSTMLKMGIKEVPWLSVDDKLMNFADSIQWINARDN